MCRGVIAVATTTVGVMEALKDQGYCRNTMRSIAQHAKNVHARSSAAKAKNNKNKSHDSSAASSYYSSAISQKLRDYSDDDHEMMKKSEESLRTVMYLSVWGPNN